MAAGTVRASSLGRRGTRKQQNKHHFVDVNKMVYPENSLQKCRRFFLHLYKNKSRPEPSVSGLPGGDKRDRTADLLNAIQALSQTHRLHTPVTGSARCASIRNTTKTSHSFLLLLIISYLKVHSKPIILWQERRPTGLWAAFSYIPPRKEGVLPHRPAIGLAFSISQQRRFLGG